MEKTPATTAFPPEAIRACVDRVTASPQLARSQRLVGFLHFVVEAVLEGTAHEVKERTLALAVYGRPADFDPDRDAIVRTEAHRLRKKLEAYYEADGSGDPIVIELPKGAYLPAFRANRAKGTSHLGPCRLVVAPLAHRGGNDAGAAFARAIGEALTARLARCPGLRVVQRSGPAGREAGGEPGDYLATGCFERHGPRCQLRVRLVRVADDHEVWSETRSFAVDELLAVKEEMAAQIAEAVGSFLERSGTPPGPGQPRAYDLYVKGRYSAVQYGNTFDDRHLEDARRRLGQAIELDPAFVDALAELANVELMQLYPPRSEPAPLLARARPLLERALHVEPRHPRSLYLLGYAEATSGRLREGLRLVETAVAIDPDDAEARHHLGLCYASLGFWESALAASEHALALDPIWELPQWLRLEMLMRTGDLEAARRVLDAMEPTISSPEEMAIGRAQLHLAQGHAEEAVRVLEASAAQAPERTNLEVALGLACACAGRRAEAEAILRARRDDPPRFRDHLIRLALALGDETLALALFEKSPSDHHYRWLAAQPSVRPSLGRPAWRALLEGLHAQWRRDVAEIGPRLPVLPPRLPTPEELLAEASAGRTRAATGSAAGARQARSRPGGPGSARGYGA